ncbi:hypothetical protein ma90 [Moumouvirus australiensis]|uniref:Uncharacterized protein n=1 Tax=Moumouvirus australiensis TaxID=2109587 RepID=A0A2P1EKU2_9VIRU|nr:hypothetical protein QKC55_gp813 [Moumouvirus australiensis]AVL94477.1 hypothetical protein ma90 [Moumouvirus australiensis]
MSKYNKLQSSSNINIVIDSENYTKTKYFDIDIIYDRNIDKIPEKKMFNNCFISLGKKTVKTDIPSGSIIYNLEIETGTVKVYRYTFSIGCKVENLYIKFEDGEKYPIISLDGKYANFREEYYKCILM